MRTFTRKTFRSASLTAILASSLLIAACSDDDDDDDIAGSTDTIVSVSVPLTEAETVNDTTGVPATAMGTADITVDTETGAVSGTATVSGLSGPATVAHIHEGAAGVAGEVIVNLVPNADRSVWTVEENAALDAAQIAAFLADGLYVNVHTELNPVGEIRGQLVIDSGPEAGSFTFAFTNTSTAQPMTPPVVALHTPLDATGGISIFTVGEPASAEVISIAEDGDFSGLVTVLEGQTTTVSGSGVAPADVVGGPLTPGATGSITLTPSDASQVLSIVSMVVCTNDGFSGVDSMALPTEETTMFLPIYDAGSETNILTLDYWVPPCGSETNISDDENGSITAHPGQSGSEGEGFDFAAGTELLQVTITPN